MSSKTSEEICTGYISFLFENASLEVRKEILDKLNGSRKLEVKPRLLFDSKIYEEDEFGLYQFKEIDKSREADKNNYFTFEDKKYSVISDETKTTISLISKNGKRIPLLTVEDYSDLILVSNDKLIIRNIISDKLELWVKNEGSYSQLSSFQLKEDEKPFVINSNELILIDSALGFIRFLSIKDDKIVLEDCPFHRIPGLHFNLIDALMLNNDLIISVSDRIIIVSFEDYKLKHKFILDKEVEVELVKINNKLFLAYSNEGAVIFQKENGKWFKLQTLNIGKIDNVTILPPEKAVIRKKAELLPINLVLDLKIEIMEFIVV